MRCQQALLVDDHPVVHEVLATIVRGALGDIIIASAYTMEDAERLLSASDFQLALVDLQLPGCTGVEAVFRVRRSAPGVLIIVVSANDTHDIVAAALRAGAKGYFPKTLLPKDMVLAIQYVVDGGVYLPFPVTATDHTSLLASLSPRQQMILQQLVDGLDNASIARKLCISQGTVKQHIHALLRTLGARSRLDAVAIYHRSNPTVR